MACGRTWGEKVLEVRKTAGAGSSVNRFVPRYGRAILVHLNIRYNVAALSPRRVISFWRTTRAGVLEAELGESPKQGIPQSEIPRSMPRDFVLFSSDHRDITDCPLDCQPDW